MMVMTAKVDLKKIMLGLAAAAAVILALILLLGGSKEESTQTAAPAVGSNDSRVKFLTDYGWDVTATPTESGQVKIPAQSSPVFERYNMLQKNQGYDLSRYAGKNVMRYVYKINNYPGSNGPVYATVLVYKNAVIGGDVTDTAPGGRIRGFKMPESTAPSTAPTTAPTTAPSVSPAPVPSGNGSTLPTM